MKLTNRLQAVADYVKKGAVVADIGTDHAYLAIYLTKNKICPYVYASDVNSGPLDRAREQVDIHGQTKHIELILSHGANELRSFQIDQVVIAGMGGGLIAEIIENNKEFFQNLDSLILQPMTGQYDLRKYLFEAGFFVKDENLAKEKHRLYQILYVEPGVEEKPWEDVEFYLGRRILEKGHELLPDLLDREEKKWSEILVQCANKETAETQARWLEAKKMLEALERVKQRDHLQGNFTNH